MIGVGHPFLYGIAIGLLLGLLICYYRQAKQAYENRDLINSGSSLLDAAQNFYGQFRAKF